MEQLSGNENKKYSDFRVVRNVQECLLTINETHVLHTFSHKLRHNLVHTPSHDTILYIQPTLLLY